MILLNKLLFFYLVNFERKCITSTNRKSAILVIKRRQTSINKVKQDTVLNFWLDLSHNKSKPETSLLFKKKKKIDRVVLEKAVQGVEALK